MTPIAAFAAGILVGALVATALWLVWAYRAMR
jgi:formate/nitrite transporter FocA (FNT family)